MSLDRMSLVGKIDPQWHKVLVRAAERDGMKLGEYTEAIILKELKHRLHEFILDRQAFADIVGTGNLGDFPR